MSTGTLANLSHLGFVRTPPAWAHRILHHLLSFPLPAVAATTTATTLTTDEEVVGAHWRVFDPTSGEGDLLAPCVAMESPTSPASEALTPGAPEVPLTPGPRHFDLYGVELSAEHAAVARARLPQATLLTADTFAVHWTPGSMDLALLNPPYLQIDSERAEYRIVKRATETLRAEGVLVAILPARSGWDTAMIRHRARYYQDIRCWKVPDQAADRPALVHMDASAPSERQDMLDRLDHPATDSESGDGFGWGCSADPTPYGATQRRSGVDGRYVG